MERYVEVGLVDVGGDIRVIFVFGDIIGILN